MNTFDDIFKRWVERNELTQDDILPILEAYVVTFNKGEFRPQETLVFAQMMSAQGLLGQLLNNALKLVGIKKGYHWAEVLDVNGNLINRIWQPQNGLIQN